MDRYYELLDWAYELVEQGDTEAARRVFDEADRERALLDTPEHPED